MFGYNAKNYFPFKEIKTIKFTYTICQYSKIKLY